MTVQSQAESLASLAESEIDVVSVAQNGTPLQTVFSMPWREMAADGTYSEMGMGETTWSNGHKFYFKELGENIRVFKVNWAIASTVTTTVVFDSTAGLIANAIIKNPLTEEQFKVLSVTNGTTAELSRWFGTSAAVNIADNTEMFFLTTTLPAGQASIDAVAVDAVEIDNEMQKIVTTIAQTDYVDYLRINPHVKDKLGGYLKSQVKEHAKRIELAMLLGQKKYDSGTQSGVMEWVLELAKRSGNYDDLSGWVTKTNLTAALIKPFKYGDTQNKTAFCWATARTTLALLFDTNKMITTNIENSTLKFSSLELPGGETVKFVSHPNMDASTGLASHIIVTDPSQIKVVYQTGEDAQGRKLSGKTQVIPNPASNYANTIIDIVTRISLMNSNAKSHWLIKL